MLYRLSGLILHLFNECKKILCAYAGADLGGGRPLPLRDSTPADPKGPPLYYFEISIFVDRP